MDNILPEISLYITKSSIVNGEMRWAAVNSDTELDLYGERMSLGLYHKMLEYIKQNVSPPEHFKSMVISDYWKGGMPYLSISHYPDLNGKAVPGQPLELFIDGKQLKAKGILFDTKLGRAVWKSLKQDEIKTKSTTDDNKIRISIAFLDLAHKHGDRGETFKRSSLTDVCSDCKKGIGNKIYLDGYLVHLALTRVPVNPRTSMESENIMPKKSQISTRKEDALSIVGDEELVDEINKSALETKSDILVEMSDVETPVVEETPLVEESKHKPDEDMTAKDQHKADMEDDMDGDEPADGKKKKMAKEYKSFTAEDIAGIVKSTLAELVAKPEETATVSKSVLDLSTENLYTSVSSAIALQGVTLEQRLESINPALQELGNTISAFVRESIGQSAPASASNEQNLVLEAIANLTNKIDGVATEVATMKAQTLQPSANAIVNRVPVPRSISPTLVAQSQATSPINPNSIANIVRRSVSSQLPLVPDKK